MSPTDIEHKLCRLEDALLLLLGNDSYLMAESKSLALQRLKRIPLQTRLKQVNSMLVVHRELREHMEHNAAFVVQQQWRMRRRRLETIEST